MQRLLELALLLLCLTVPSRTLACVVGTGTAASCTEAALNACLPGGGSFDGTVTFNCGGAATITVTSTKIIGADTAIDGEILITISGGNSVGVFSVDTGVNFTVQNLTIANGNSAGSGGGIDNYGTLTVTNSTFSGNSAGSGGGIENNGTLTVTNSTFSGNSASNGGGTGGGIFNGGALTVTNSTFSGNHAYAGGGIFNEVALTVTNSTFSGNHTYYPSGGGIYSTYGGTVTVANTIVADSTLGCSFAGGVTDGGHNIDDGTTCGFTGTGCATTTGSSFCNTNPQLDPAGIANNGGPTQTLALEPGSPAINAGDETVCAAPPVNNLDQRGFVRPGPGHTSCSIGAYEAESPGGLTPTPTPTFTTTATLTPTPTSTPRPCTGDCDGQNGVSLGELVRCLEIVNGSRALTDCAACDTDGNVDGRGADLGDLVRALLNANDGGCR